MQSSWVEYALLTLIFEKTIQHIVVSLAFYYNWQASRSTMVINPTLLMVLGAVVAVAFACSLWGILMQNRALARAGANLPSAPVRSPSISGGIAQIV